MDGKVIADAIKLVKKLIQCSLEWGSDKCPRHDYVWIRGKEAEDGSLNDRKPWNGKQIGQLLLIVFVADPEQFTDKSKPITYIAAFVKLYNWRNSEQVHEIYGMVKFEKMRTSTAKHPRNLGAYHIIEISSILRSVYIIPRNKERIMFYINNYIDWDQFNQLYAPNWLEKGLQNADTVAQKLTPASIKATDLRRDAVRQKQKVVDRQKLEAIARKRRRDRGGSSLSIEDNGYYDNETSTDSDQENGLNPLGDDWNWKSLWMFNELVRSFVMDPQWVNIKRLNSFSH